MFLELLLARQSLGKLACRPLAPPAPTSRGTAAVKEMLSPELAKWFVSYESIIGTAVRVLEM